MNIRFCKILSSPRTLNLEGCKSFSFNVSVMVEKSLPALGWSISSTWEDQRNSAALGLKLHVPVCEARSLAGVGGLPRGRQKAQPRQKETLPVSVSLKTEVLQLLREKVPRRFYQGQTTHTFCSLFIFWNQSNHSGWNFLCEKVTQVSSEQTPCLLERKHAEKRVLQRVERSILLPPPQSSSRNLRRWRCPTWLIWKLRLVFYFFFQQTSPKLLHIPHT